MGCSSSKEKSSLNFEFFEKENNVIVGIPIDVESKVYLSCEIDRLLKDENYNREMIEGFYDDWFKTLNFPHQKIVEIKPNFIEGLLGIYKKIKSISSMKYQHFMLQNETVYSKISQWQYDNCRKYRGWISDIPYHNHGFDYVSEAMVDTYTKIPQLKNIKYILYNTHCKSESPMICISDKKVFVCGAGQNGELGTGYMNDAVNIPTSIFSCHGDEKIVFGDTNFRCSFILTNNGKLYTWGWNCSGAGHRTFNYPIYDTKYSKKEEIFTTKGWAIHNTAPKIPEDLENKTIIFAAFTGTYNTEDSLVVIDNNYEIFKSSKNGEWTKVTHDVFENKLLPIIKKRYLFFFDSKIISY